MAERRYTKNGEWAAFDGRVWKVGLSAPAVADLGEVTFVELPAPGQQVTAGEAVCGLEAVKAAMDFYSPLDGRIAEVNVRLGAEPQLVNASPEADGWLFSLEGVPAEGVEVLLDERAWKAWESGR
jgi:glycine cleavage system H protein